MPRRLALLLFLTPAACAWLSCDRDTLTDGPRLKGSQPALDPGGGTDEGGGETPDPGCPPPQALTDLQVKINEVMVENTTTLEDERGQFPAWIELYNPTEAEVDLGGVPLSDDFVDLEKWKLPCTREAVLPPHGYLVIFFDGDTEHAGDLHASLRLPAGAPLQLILNKGSDFFLFDASGLAADRSVGRFPDGDPNIAYLSGPTPRAANLPPAAPPGPREAEFVRGDVNGDGRVNVTDMQHLLRVLFLSQPPPGCQDRLDANDDGTVNLSDALYIGSFLFQGGPAIPPPFPAAGRDPTADALPCPAE